MSPGDRHLRRTHGEIARPFDEYAHVTRPAGFFGHVEPGGEAAVLDRYFDRRQPVVVRSPVAA